MRNHNTNIINLLSITLLYLGLIVHTGCKNGIVEPLPNIVLITLDTTNAEALGCYGNNDISTPFLDTLAKSGVRFTRCLTHAPITLPSHSSILTGLIPPQHGVRNNSTYKLSEKWQTLPEILKTYDYQTAAFVSSVILDSQYGLDQGFDLYEDEIVHYRSDKKKRTIVTRRAEETFHLANKWIETTQNPFFTWIHLYDPHWPYEPPAPFAEGYADNKYFGELAYLDFQLGVFLKKLKQQGRLDSTLFIITGDHGESLGRHAESSHGMFTYLSTTHVPLILAGNLSVFDNARGEVHDYTVSSIDIVPTILLGLGIPVPDHLNGVNLFSKKPREVYSEAMIPFENQYCAPLSSLKNQNYSVYKSSVWEAYDLREDFNEGQNIFSDPEPTDADLGDLIQQLKGMSLNLQSTKTEIVQLDPETIELLKSLGYAHDGGTFIPKEEDALNRAAPYSVADMITGVQSGKNYEDTYPFRYIQILEELKEKYPEQPLVLQELGRLNLMAGNEEASLVLLKAAAVYVPEDPRMHSLLAYAFTRFRRFDEALDEYRIALEISPEHLVSRFNASVALLETGKIEAARENLKIVLDAHPNDIFALNNMALILFEHDHLPEKALVLLQKAQENNPNHPLLKKNIQRVENGL